MAEDTLISFEHVKQALTDYGAAVVELYKKNLIQSDHLATEQLVNNVSYHLTTETYTIAVDISLMEYFKYVEWDTRPHFPPIDAIKNWLHVRNIVPQPRTGIRHTKTKGDVKFTYTPTENQLAYLIGRRIAENGTTGSHDLENAVEQVNRDFLQRLEDAVTADIDAAADVVFNRFFDINY